MNLKKKVEKPLCIWEPHDKEDKNIWSDQLQVQTWIYKCYKVKNRSKTNIDSRTKYGANQ